MDRTNQWLTLAANLGVIAGLLFLAYEIRQNTNIAKASAYRENIQDIAAWRELTITDPELSRLFFAVYMEQGIEALNDGDRGRVSALVNNIMGIYENAFFARSYGIVGDEEWTRFQSGACVHFLVARENQLNLRFVTPRFRQHLEETCETPGSPGSGRG
jgi:hypothetical protein